MSKILCSAFGSTTVDIEQHLLGSDEEEHHRLFKDAYLPEHQKDFDASSMTECPNFFKIEDGWLGYKLNGPFIALVFECPDQKSAQNILKQIQINLIKMEDNHVK